MSRVGTRLFATLAIVLVVSWLGPVAGVGRVPLAAAAATDLTLVTDTVYTVQPEQRRVAVSVAVTARNNTRETKTQRFFFDHAFLAVLPTASDVKVTGAKGVTARVTRRTSDAAIVRIDFGGRLYSGKSRAFTVTFNLVDSGGTTDRSIRVTSNLVTLPVWAHATTGAQGGSVRVVIPPGYDVAVERGSFASRTAMPGGGVELATGTLTNPLTFFAYVSAQKPAEYTDVPLDVPAGGQTVNLTLRGWKDDSAWLERVRDLFTRSLPELRQEIGLPWPHADRMVVQEAVSRAAGGYAGLFDPGDGRIEVAYWADHLIVIHEAAHGWFNGSLLADRWADEGFASLYAERVAAAIGEKGGTSPALTDQVRASAIPLNAWAVPPTAPADGSGAAEGDAARATETYGYAASLALAKAISDRAGDDALRAVWADAAAQAGAYQPPVAAGTTATPPATGETTGAAPDWRGFLDLLEDRTGKDFTDLWRQWVVRPDESGLLDARAEARQGYVRTLAVAKGWALPRSIRDALRAWQFPLAQQLMADARTVLAQRGAIEQMARQAGLTLPGSMRQLFEAGKLVEASGTAEAERNAMVAIDQAAAARTSDSDVMTRIGMLGEDPDADLARAKTALAAGDVDTTLTASDAAYRAWTGAWQEGRRRILLLVAVLATIVVLGSALVGRARAARRRPVAVAAAPEQAATAAPPPDDPDPTPEELLAASTPRWPDLSDRDRT